MPCAAAIIMPLLETKAFGAVCADGQLQSCVVPASTWVALLVVTSSFVVAPWVPQGGCVWLVVVWNFPCLQTWEEENTKDHL